MAALAAGDCMYAPVSPCSGPPGPNGLRDSEDMRTLLVYRAHSGRLRKLGPRDLAELESVLVRAFSALGS